MILVLLGTFPTEFKRPLLEINKLCQEGHITEEVIVQNGYTKIESKFLTLIPFIELKDLDDLYKKSRIIITHGGSGSLIKGLKLNKKIIAIARLSKYGEVVDDHQLEILNEFEKNHYILHWRENEPLRPLLEAAEIFEPAQYSSRKTAIIDFLTNYIDSL
jgi:UDP-N-acetylglucosamine transferase subunit ALG13